MALRWCLCREEGNYPWFWQTTLLYLPWALSKSVRTCLHKEHQQVTSNIWHISPTKMSWEVQCKKSSRSFSLWIGSLSRKKAQTLNARNAVLSVMYWSDLRWFFTKRIPRSQGILKLHFSMFKTSSGCSHISFINLCK